MTFTEWPSEGVIAYYNFLSRQPNTAMDSVPFRDGNIHAILDSRYLHSPLVFFFIFPITLIQSVSTPRDWDSCKFRFSIWSMTIFDESRALISVQDFCRILWFLIILDHVHVPLVFFRMLITLCRLILLSFGGFLKKES